MKHRLLADLSSWTQKEYQLNFEPVDIWLPAHPDKRQPDAARSIYLARLSAHNTRENVDISLHPGSVVLIAAGEDMEVPAVIAEIKYSLSMAKFIFTVDYLYGNEERPKIWDRNMTITERKINFSNISKVFFLVL